MKSALEDGYTRPCEIEEAARIDVGDDAQDTMAALDIYHLHPRHPGMAPGVADNFAVNAIVCMSRHHASPTAWSVRIDDGWPARYLARWDPPTDDQLRSCANMDDATRDGAYGVALAATEVHLQLVALRRAEGRSGSDFYLIPAGSEPPASPEYDLDRDDLIRLEVSGIDNDDDAKLRSRVRQKVQQAIDGKSLFPAIAAVVGFKTAQVVMRSARG